MLYGAAEFSRDSDFVVLASDENLDRFQEAMRDLEARVIAVPPLSLDYLARGHAVHFRCYHRDAVGMRVDIMSRLRGVRPFDALWEDRTTVTLDEISLEVNVLGIRDLVAAKKTQRDKDWPMIKRLVDASFLQCSQHPTPQAVEFWLLEMRTPDLLIQVVREWPEMARRLLHTRPLLADAIHANGDRIDSLLLEEQRLERQADKAYWEPLRRELEHLRHARFDEDALS